MSDMVARAIEAIKVHHERDKRFIEPDDQTLAFVGGNPEAMARDALLAALDPPREEISAISDDSSVSFELVCSVLMALRRRSQGDTVD
jgi:hypothetical protein